MASSHTSFYVNSLVSAPHSSFRIFVHLTFMIFISMNQINYNIPRKRVNSSKSVRTKQLNNNTHTHKTLDKKNRIIQKCFNYVFCFFCYFFIKIHFIRCFWFVPISQWDRMRFAITINLIIPIHMHFYSDISITNECERDASNSNRKESDWEKLKSRYVCCVCTILLCWRLWKANCLRCLQRIQSFVFNVLPAKRENWVET